MTDTPSFQDLLDDFADEVFVGRSEQLSLFEGAIKAAKPSFLILNISGQGGVGKSTLLERYRGISKSNDVAYAIVNEDHLAIPKILETFVQQLEQEGLSFDHFNERYRKYQELKEKVEADPKVPSGLMDFALRGIAKVGMKSLKRIPVAGDVADVFLSPESEEVIADQASEFTKYIFQKFTNKDERVLLLETDSELSKYFLDDLTKALKTGKAILSFDTYEKTSENIEKWLIDLLLGEFGQFSSNVLFVIAGRYALGQNWTRFRKAIRQVELKEFTEEEAKDYLTRSGVTDEKLISQFIEITERLPVLLALLVSSPNQLPHDVSGDAVQRFLQGLTSEQREAALISSLPRYFNSDILVSILGGEEGKTAFEWLSRAHFVRTSENGWMYHDVVRLMMLRYFRMRSNQQFVDTHKLLEEYYKKQIFSFGIDTNVQKISTLSSKFETEKTYHFLCQNPLKNVESLVKYFTAMLWRMLSDLVENISTEKEAEETIELLTASYSNPLLQLCDEISDLTTKDQLDNLRDLAKLFSDDLSSDRPELFDWLLNIDDLSDQERSVMFLFRAYSRDFTEKDRDYKLALNDLNKVIQLNPSSILCYMTRSQYFNANKKYDLALLDLSKAIELRPENEYIYSRRGRTYSDIDDYSSAIADFTKAIELQPENGDNYYWRGRTYAAMKEYPSALSDLTKAIELQPEDGDNYYRRGQTYSKMEEYPSALSDLTKAIELQPEDGYNYYERGRTYFNNTEDYPSALTDFTKAIELQPENGDNYYGRGLTHYAIKDYASALTDFTKAIELQPENGDNYYRRGLTYYNIKGYPSALTDFTKAIELQPEDRYNYYERGRTYFSMKDYASALTDFTKAIELQPENGYNYYRRALCEYIVSNQENYKEDFKTSLHLLKTNYEQDKEAYIAFEIALCLFANEEVEKAKDLYVETIKQCFEKDDLTDALEDLEELTGLTGKTTDAESVVKLFHEALAKFA